MKEKIIQVFYGENYLPYKDKSRSVAFPLVGNVMLGSSGVCKVRFYVSEIGDINANSWVVISKLPNGKILYEVLETTGHDNDINEDYVDFDISSHYTNIKGAVTISLSAYEGEILLQQDEDTGIYEIYGTPLIATTGSISLAINYTVQIINQDAELSFNELQMLLAYIATKNNISTAIVVKETRPLNLSDYNEGQLFFIKADNLFYELVNGQLVEFDIFNPSETFLTVEENEYVIPVEDR